MTARPRAAFARAFSMAVLAGLGASTCRTAPPTQPSDLVTASATPGPSASPLAAPDAAPTLPADAAPEIEARAISDPKLVSCGKQRCRAGTESCCLASDVGACTPTLAPGPPDQGQLLAEQIQACDTLKLPTALTAIVRCDESVDCAEREICCEQFLFGGATASLCVAGKSAQSPCDAGERCLEGSPCRIAGTVCTRGHCRKPVSKLRCGKATCSGGAPACCGDPPTCKPDGECDSFGRFECARPADCLPGEHCQLSPMGTWCMGMLDTANARVVCESDKDCPDLCMGGPGKTRCKKSELDGILACACP